MDEIFSSTNPEDGISAGYSILDYIGKKKNNICLITTHYRYLTTLDNFENFKFQIIINKDGSFKYLYKLKKGVNDQYIALELMKKYINNTIYENALSIRKKISEKI